MLLKGVRFGPGSYGAPDCMPGSAAILSGKRVLACQELLHEAPGLFRIGREFGAQGFGLFADIGRQIVNREAGVPFGLCGAGLELGKGRA